MSGRVILLMTQIDDAPGELLGEVMKTLVEKEPRTSSCCPAWARWVGLGTF
jgi:uncharacterized protein (DUF111 family)